VKRATNHAVSVLCRDLQTRGSEYAMRELWQDGIE
jgi:hypothetical protein